MNSYTLAIGILATGVFLAVLMWTIPILRRHRRVRRFRKDLANVEVMTVNWAYMLRETEPSDDVPAPLGDDLRRPRRHRRDDPDDGRGDALV